MNKLFFDIETLPAPKDLHKMLEEIHQKKIDEGKKVTPDFEEFIEQTNLDGVFGRNQKTGSDL